MGWQNDVITTAAVSNPWAGSAATVTISKQQHVCNDNFHTKTPA